MSHPRARPALSAGLLLAALLLAPAPAPARFDPAHRWRSAETAHFEVVFPEGAEALAARAAAIAEDVHARLAPRLGWSPQGRTRLILADDADLAGGWASPYPYNQLFISPTPPGAESGLGPTPGDAWLRLVITHEYTHVLQLDMVTGGAPAAVDRLFGRLWFPNLLQPIWLVEGLAVYEETELAAGGRGRLPAAQMVLRMAALADEVPGLDAMAVFPDAWPAGRVPYLFGESFLRYLADRHGRDAVADLSRENARRNLPFLVGSTGRRVLGEDYDALWRSWSGELRARARGEADAIEALGLTPSAAVTAGGWTNLSPAWSPDGGRIAWLAAGEEAGPGLWAANADGSGGRRLVAAPFVSAGLAWSRDGGRIYFARVDLVRGAAVRSDIRAWDLRTRREVEITRGLRARDPDVSPDGRELLAVRVGDGRSSLVLVPLDGALPVADPARLRTLAGPAETQFERPRWSPDGQRIAVAVRRTDGTSAVALLDRDGTTLAELPCGRAAAGPPSWSPGGATVFFSSDRGGVFNVFAWEPARGTLRQVTNVLGGAFSPAPAPDGRRLAFAGYSARGFDIRTLDLDPRAWRDAAAADARAPLPPEAPAPALASRPYTPLPTLAPRLWIPWLLASPESGTLAGFLTGSQDAAQRHRYLAGAFFGPSSGRLSWLLDYTYEGLVPSLRLAASDADTLHAGLLDGGADYVERRRAAEVALSFPLGSLEAPQALAIGFRHRGLTALSPLPDRDGAQLPARGRLGSTRLSWSLDTTERPVAAISAERGLRLALGVERFAKGFDSERSFTRAVADWAQFLPLPPRHHALAARLFAGSAWGDAPLQGAYEMGGDAPGAIAHSLDDEALPLRGYPPGAARGDRALLGTLEYRFPLAPLESGGRTAPLFLRRLHGAVFAEAGAAWSGELARADLRRSVGAEVRLDLYLAYHLPVTLRAGLAWGLDRDGGLRPLAGLWLSGPLAGGSAPTGKEVP